MVVSISGFVHVEILGRCAYVRATRVATLSIPASA